MLDTALVDAALDGDARMVALLLLLAGQSCTIKLDFIEMLLKVRPNRFANLGQI